MLNINHKSFQSCAHSFQIQILEIGGWSFLHVVHMAESDSLDVNETYKQIMTDIKSSQPFQQYLNFKHNLQLALDQPGLYSSRSGSTNFDLQFPSFISLTLYMITTS